MSEQPITRRDTITALGTGATIGLAGCVGQLGGDTGTPGDQASPTGGKDEVTGAWIYIGTVGDLGWSWAHDQGRQQVDEAFDWLDTEFAESVPESDFRNVAEEYSNQGVDIIFGTSFGYNDAMLEISQAHPDIAYEHCTGFNDGDNLGLYYGRDYEGRYLAGYAAGLLTEADKIGYVAAFPIASVLAGMNGFAAGVQHANPDATILVRWTNTWFDPGTEKEAARALVDEGVDVMTQHQDSPSTITVAAENDLWGIGWDAPMGEFGGDTYVTSVIWHWSEFYNQRVQEVKEGTWEADFWYKGLESGVIGLDEWGPNVPADVQSAVDERQQAIIDDEHDIWEGTKYEGKQPEFWYYDISSLAENIDGEMP